MLLRILGFLPGREAKVGSPQLRGSGWYVLPRLLREGLAPGLLPLFLPRA